MAETFSNPENSQQEKLPMPQLNKKGVSQDIINSFAALYTMINSSNFSKEEILDMYKNLGIQTYSERFSPQIYDRSYETNETRQIVAALDELTTKLRNLFETDTITRDKFNDIYEEIKTILA